MLRVFMAPATEPDRLTLQADPETWRSVLDLLARDDLTAFSELDRLLKQQPVGPVLRLTLPDEQARRILALAGVSA